MSMVSPNACSFNGPKALGYDQTVFRQVMIVKNIAILSVYNHTRVLILQKKTNFVDV